MGIQLDEYFPYDETRASNLGPVTNTFLPIALTTCLDRCLVLPFQARHPDYSAGLRNGPRHGRLVLLCPPQYVFGVPAPVPRAEVGDGLGPVLHPVKGDKARIRVAHDDLANHLYAVICGHRLALTTHQGYLARDTGKAVRLTKMAAIIFVGRECFRRIEVPVRIFTEHVLEERKRLTV